MKIIWYMVLEIWSITKFFLTLDHFLPFYRRNNPESQNFEKIKKMPEDIIIPYKCTTNDNHMMYDSWDWSDRQDFLSFGAIFCTFTPLTTQKIKILKKWTKTPGDIIILHKWTKNYDHMLYCSWDMVFNGCNYFSFWLFFALQPP